MYRYSLEVLYGYNCFTPAAFSLHGAALLPSAAYTLAATPLLSARGKNSSVGVCKVQLGSLLFFRL